MGRSQSAQRTANLVGCNHRKVERIRKILKDGTPEIQDAVRNGKMTINKAYNVVIKKPPVKRAQRDRNKPLKELLGQEDIAALEDLGGGLKQHLNAAVRLYRAWLRGEDRLTAENAEHAESNKG